MANTTDTASIDMILVAAPGEWMPAAVCPCCGGQFWVNTGRRSNGARKEAAEWKLASHKAKGSKCAGSGTRVHYSPMVAGQR